MTDHPEDLLPWYANQTLAADERARVERHLAGCAHCRAELELLLTLRQEVKVATAEGPGEMARARLLKAVRQSRKTTPRWVPLALAASVAVIAIQGALLVRFWQPDDRYVPLGSAQPSAAVVLQVRFVPTASEGDIRAMLQSVGATLVDGPSALGIYRVQIVGVRPNDDARVSSVIQQLRSMPAVIAHVERDA
jgi:anti-sigma factor RsiW